MITRLRKNIDSFGRDIIVVFAGTTLLNLSNLLYQLLIAHKLSPVDFAAFNCLLAIFIIISAPLSTIQMALAKYVSEFKARGQSRELKVLLSDSLVRFSVLAALTFFIFYFAAAPIVNSLKIPSFWAAYIFALLLASMWLIPLLKGVVQGAELFNRLSAGLTVTGVTKLILAFAVLSLGYGIAGAMAALLAAELAGLAVYSLSVRGWIDLRPSQRQKPDYAGIFRYLLPVAAAYFCFMALVNSDMVLVKYFFSRDAAAFYSLAQMVGKIFLFLPVAIGTVMFPRTSGLNAQKQDTSVTLKRSIVYVTLLCAAAAVFYNLVPGFVLKVLTGKAFAESILLGRLFSVSMSLFTLSYLLMFYFLSIKDMRFIKYLFFSLSAQTLAIVFLHDSLLQVQITLCLNSALLLSVQLILARRHGLRFLR